MSHGTDLPLCILQKTILVLAFVPSIPLCVPLPSQTHSTCPFVPGSLPFRDATGRVLVDMQAFQTSCL